MPEAGSEVITPLAQPEVEYRGEFGSKVPFAIRVDSTQISELLRTEMSFSEGQIGAIKIFVLGEGAELPRTASWMPERVNAAVYKLNPLSSAGSWKFRDEDGRERVGVLVDAVRASGFARRLTADLEERILNETGKSDRLDEVQRAVDGFFFRRSLKSHGLSARGLEVAEYLESQNVDKDQARLVFEALLANRLQRNVQHSLMHELAHAKDLFKDRFLMAKRVSLGLVTGIASGMASFGLLANLVPNLHVILSSAADIGVGLTFARAAVYYTGTEKRAEEVARTHKHLDKWFDLVRVESTTAPEANLPVSESGGRSG